MKKETESLSIQADIEQQGSSSLLWKVIQQIGAGLIVTIMAVAFAVYGVISFLVFIAPFGVAGLGIGMVGFGVWKWSLPWIARGIVLTAVGSWLVKQSLPK